MYPTIEQPQINENNIINEMLPHLSNILESTDNYSTSLSLLDSFDLKLKFINVEDYIEVPQEYYKYCHPSSNQNFYTELYDYVLKNTNSYISSYSLEDKPAICFDIKINMCDEFGEFDNFNKYLSDSYFTKYFTLFYLSKVVEILNKNNIKFITEPLFDNISKYVNDGSKMFYDKDFSNNLINTFKANLELESDKVFEIIRSESNINEDFLKSVVRDHQMVNVSELSFEEQIAFSCVIKEIETIKESVYLKDLIEKNINESLFLGHLSKQLYDFYLNHENGKAPLNDGLFLFVHKGLEVLSKHDFNDRFPEPNEEMSLIFDNYSFSGTEEFFSCVMPYIV